MKGDPRIEIGGIARAHGIKGEVAIVTHDPESTILERAESLWIDGIEHKIVEGVLWIRSASAMLGYLNSPSPFEADGWFNTQDLVECDGAYIRILGRKSELINVGGEKVHPTEIENVLLQLDNIKDVTVRGQPNPVTGEVVAASITPLVPEDPDALKRRVDDAVKYIDLDRLAISTQCGFASSAAGNPVTEADQTAKLQRVVEAARAIWR